jgi:hypothetical protein
MYDLAWRLYSVASHQKETRMSECLAAGTLGQIHNTSWASRIDRIGIVFLAVALIYLQRFAINNISIMFFVMYFNLLLLLALGKAFIDVRRLVLYAIAMGALCVTALVTQHHAFHYSWQSMVYLSAIYFAVLFVRYDFEMFEFFLVVYQNAMLIAAVLGIFQFLIQLMGVPYVDVLASIFPPWLLKEGYNTSYGVEWRSAIHKSNGIFFLEPSYFSRHAAVSILIELLFLKKMYRLAIFIPALLISFSGTGIMILAFVAVPLLTRIQLKYTVALTLVALVSFVVLVYSGFAEHILRRGLEFSDSSSSGYSRFVAPGLCYSDFLHTDHIWLGKGPGYASLFEDDDPFLIRHFYSVTYAKLGMEYGLVGLLAFTAFAANNFFHRTTSRIISAGMFFEYYIFVGGLMGAENVLFGYSLLMLFRKPAQEKNSVQKLSPKPTTVRET